MGDAQKIVSLRLKEWRLALREENITCLDTVRALEVELNYRWRMEDRTQVRHWLKNALASTKDPCSSSLAMMNWCGKKKAGTRGKDEPKQQSYEYTSLHVKYNLLLHEQPSSSTKHQRQSGIRLHYRCRRDCQPISLSINDCQFHYVWQI